MNNKAYAAIQRALPYLNPALKRIGTFILENPEQCKTITTKSLASSCGVAESTVTRFVKEIGFSGFQELKISLAEYLTSTELQNAEPLPFMSYEDISPSDSINEVIQKLTFQNNTILNETMQSLNPEPLQQAVECIKKAELILIISQGFSSVAAQEAKIMFSRIGKRCVLYEDECNMRMAASICKPTDLLMGISNSGRTKIVTESLQIAKEHGGMTIGITSFEDSPLALQSDIAVITPTKSKYTENGMTWELASAKTAQLLVIDILCTCYSMKYRDDALHQMEVTYQALKDTRHPQ